MSDLDQQRRAFEEIKPQLEDIEAQVRRWLEGTVRELRLVEARVSSRVKKPHSFVLKILARQRAGTPWADPLVDSTDKVGARVDVVYLEDVESLKEQILGATDVFDVLKVEDKLKDELDADKLGYQGVHIDVRLRDLPDGIAPEHAVSEIQVRTLAQAAWAMAGHDLTYKSPVDLTIRQLRRMNRLTALLELFDDEVRSAVSELMGNEGYPAAIIIRTLERAWLDHVADEYNHELTRDIVVALVDDLTASQAHDLEAAIERFAAEERSRLDEVFAEPFVGSPLKAQPESVLVFYLLDEKPQWLQHRWIEAGLDHDLLDELATIWGVRLAAPR